jgi:hypothetical protein
MALGRAASEEQVLREKAHNNTKRRNWTKYTSPCVLLGFTT